MIQTGIVALSETRRPLMENTLKPGLRQRLMLQAIISIIELVLNTFQRSFFPSFQMIRFQLLQS